MSADGNIAVVKEKGKARSGSKEEISIQFLRCMSFSVQSSPVETQSSNGWENKYEMKLIDATRLVILSI